MCTIFLLLVLLLSPAWAADYTVSTTQEQEEALTQLANGQALAVVVQGIVNRALAGIIAQKQAEQGQLAIRDLEARPDGRQILRALRQANQTKRDEVYEAMRSILLP